jgi:hypothetical protein
VLKRPAHRYTIRGISIPFRKDFTMRLHTVLALLLFLAPQVARAQETPEQLLSAGTQIYLRWDGVDAHRAAFEKSALGAMLKGDTGKFFDGVVKQLQQSAGSALTVAGLLSGKPPEQLEKLQADASEATKLLGLFSEKGLILAVEGRAILPAPQAQATLIIPDAGDKSKALFGAIKLIAGLADIPIKETKTLERTVFSIQAEPVHITWWLEGKHAVLLVGTDKPEDAVKRMRTGNHARLVSSPMFKKLTEFKDFETAARAYVDVAGIVKLAALLGKEATEIIDILGLNGLKTITFHSGFEGNAERGLVVIDAPGPRKGLLSLLNGKPFKLGDVPPLPDDVISWQMASFDPAGSWDRIVGLIETVVAVLAKDQLPMVQEAIKQIDITLGVNLRQDVLGALGEYIVQYASPSEGAFSVSQAILLKVKDADKLQTSLDKLVRNLSKATGLDISLKKRKYRDVEVREVHVKQQGFIFLPTYAIHKGWLVLGYYPQTVQGYILRANGEVPAWKPDGKVMASLEKMPQEWTAISVSDPRPTVKMLAALAPLVAASVNSFAGDNYVDVGLMPNAHEMCKHLFPNVSVTTDDGKQLVSHTRASLALPFDLGGSLDSLFLAFAFASLANGF